MGVGEMLRQEAEETMAATTYSVMMIDSETPAEWMGASYVVSSRPGHQDAVEIDGRMVGRCAWTVETTDAAALELALDADSDVLEYTDMGPAACHKHSDCCEHPDLGLACAESNGYLCDYHTSDRIRPATSIEAAASRDAASRDGGAGVIAINGRSCYVEA